MEDLLWKIKEALWIYAPESTFDYEIDEECAEIRITECSSSPIFSFPVIADIAKFGFVYVHYSTQRKKVELVLFKV